MMVGNGQNDIKGEKTAEGKLKKRRRLKPFLITLVILAVVGYLIYDGMYDTMTYYLTVSEVLAKPLELQNETIRVGGNVTLDSVRWDPRELLLSFKIEDENSSIKVDYQGVVPDSFKPGREVVVEGIYETDGQFKASKIMPKCASKYE
jgi:cytochrome c-type biogenesis protein CcmE